MSVTMSEGSEGLSLRDFGDETTLAGQHESTRRPRDSISSLNQYQVLTNRRAPSAQFRRQRQQLYASVSREDILNKLIVTEHDFSRLRDSVTKTLLRQQQMDQRMLDAEASSSLSATSIAELVAYKVSSVVEIQSLQHQLMRYKQQLDLAQASVLHAQDTVEYLTRQRDEALEEARHIRKANHHEDSEHYQYTAMQEGRDLGYDSGLRAAQEAERIRLEMARQEFDTEYYTQPSTSTSQAPPQAERRRHRHRDRDRDQDRGDTATYNTRDEISEMSAEDRRRRRRRAHSPVRDIPQPPVVQIPQPQPEPIITRPSSRGVSRPPSAPPAPVLQIHLSEPAIETRPPSRSGMSEMLKSPTVYEHYNVEVPPAETINIDDDWHPPARGGLNRSASWKPAAWIQRQPRGASAEYQSSSAGQTRPPSADPMFRPPSSSARPPSAGARPPSAGMRPPSAPLRPPSVGVVRSSSAGGRPSSAMRSFTHDDAASYVSIPEEEKERRRREKGKQKATETWYLREGQEPVVTMPTPTPYVPPSPSPAPAPPIVVPPYVPTPSQESVRRDYIYQPRQPTPMGPATNWQAPIVPVAPQRPSALARTGSFLKNSLGGLARNRSNKNREQQQYQQPQQQARSASAQQYWPAFTEQRPRASSVSIRSASEPPYNQPPVAQTQHRRAASTNPTPGNTNVQIQPSQQTHGQPPGRRTLWHSNTPQPPPPAPPPSNRSNPSRQEHQQYQRGDRGVSQATEHLNQMHPGQGVQHSRQGPFDSVRMDWRNQPQQPQQAQPWQSDPPRPPSTVTTVLATPPFENVGSDPFTISPHEPAFVPDAPPDSEWAQPRTTSHAPPSPYAASLNQDIQRSPTPPSPPPLQVPPIQRRRSPQPGQSRHPDDDREPSPPPKPIPPMTPRTEVRPMAESRVTSARASPAPSRFSRLSRPDSEIATPVPPPIGPLPVPNSPAPSLYKRFSSREYTDPALYSNSRLDLTEGMPGRYGSGAASVKSGKSGRSGRSGRSRR